MNELTTDESNDVVFMEEPGPKSFKDLFPHEHKTSDTKKTVSAEISPAAAKDTDDQEKDKQQHKDLSSKSKNDGNGATKRTDWDMFAEQDIDSNFDVIKSQLAASAAAAVMHVSEKSYFSLFSFTESKYNCRKQNHRG